MLLCASREVVSHMAASAKSQRRHELPSALFRRKERRKVSFGTRKSEGQSQRQPTLSNTSSRALLFANSGLLQVANLVCLVCCASTFPATSSSSSNGGSPQHREAICPGRQQIRTPTCCAERFVHSRC